MEKVPSLVRTLRGALDSEGKELDDTIERLFSVRDGMGVSQNDIDRLSSMDLDKAWDILVSQGLDSVYGSKDLFKKAF
jgi:hypothetical protein